VQPNELEIPAKLSGERLDAILAALYPSHSKSALQKLVRRGAVTLDGKRVVRSNVRPRPKALVHIDLPVAASKEAAIPVLFEDEHLVVLDKPAGMLTHGHEREEGTSLADVAVQRFGRLPMLMGEERPGVVHRLDRETSGAIVLARTPTAMERLREAFRGRSVRKEYLALVHGSSREDAFVVDAPLGPMEGHRDRQVIRHDDQGKAARTEFEVRERFGRHSLVACRLITGRRHQIRVHLLEAGLPLVGDKLYGARDAKALPVGAPALVHHALHAARIGFEHPVLGGDVEVEAPPRAEIAELIEWLRSRSSEIR